MAESVNLPEGFILDQDSSALPSGFVLDSPHKERSTAKEIARPFLRAAKSIVAGTVGGAADLANLAVEAPLYAGYKLTEAVRGKNTEYKPIFADKSVTKSINKGFDRAAGGLTANRNQGEELLEIPQEILGAPLGGAAATKIGQGARNFSQVPKELLKKFTGIQPDNVKAFEEAGVNPRMADVAAGQTTKTFQNVLANFPGSRGVIEKATQEQIDNITKQISTIAKSEGGTIQQTGKTLQEGAKNLRNIANRRAENLFGNLDRFIPKDSAGNRVAISTGNFANAIKDPMIQDVAAVKEGTIQRLINRYEKLAGGGDKIPYDRLKIFRGTLGKESYSHLLSETEQGAAKYLYGALSRDMKSAVEGFGGKAGAQAFDKANNAFYRHLEILNDKVNPLIDAKTPEAVYGMALSGSKQGGSNIKIIMKGLEPEQRDFVRGTIVKRMGLANPGTQDATGEVFNPTKFLTEWNRLSPEARANIFTKEQTNAIGNLNKAIDKIKETGKARQSSNNLPYGLWAGLGYMARGSVIGAGAAIGAANITAKMMTNPKFINWLAQTPKISPSAMPKHIKLLSGIAAANPDIRDDLLNYLESITIEKE